MKKILFISGFLLLTVPAIAYFGGQPFGSAKFGVGEFGSGSFGEGGVSTPKVTSPVNHNSVSLIYSGQVVNYTK